MEHSVAAIICAAGISSRMGGIENKKEFQHISRPSSQSGENLTVLGSAVKAFAELEKIKPIIITLPREIKNADEYLPEELRGKVHYCTGGATRRISVQNALIYLKKFNRTTHVLIHDGARPWIKKNLIENIIKAAIKYDAVIPALPQLETPKELDGIFVKDKPSINFIKRHLRRAELCSAQTPQGFSFPEILRAHEKAAGREKSENYEYTDDAEVWGEFIGKVAVIPGDKENIKITFPEDLL